jgi:hypothetical protein
MRVGMSEIVRQVIEIWLPAVLDRTRITRWLQWIYWPATVAMGLLLIATNPIFGSFVVGAPMLLLWQTRRRGLAHVPVLFLVGAAAMALVPAFFLGRVQQVDEALTGLPLAGFVIFFAWMSIFPVLLGRFDEQSRQPVCPAGSAVWHADPQALVRLTLVRLWIATVSMTAVDNQLAVAVCVVALLYRRRWTAGVACVVCAVSPLLSFSAGQFTWDLSLLGVPAAALAGYQWLRAALLSRWTPPMNRSYLEDEEFPI